MFFRFFLRSNSGALTSTRCRQHPQTEGEGPIEVPRAHHHLPRTGFCMQDLSALVVLLLGLVFIHEVKSF